MCAHTNTILNRHSQIHIQARTTATYVPLRPCRSVEDEAAEPSATGLGPRPPRPPPPGATGLNLCCSCWKPKPTTLPGAAARASTKSRPRAVVPIAIAWFVGLDAVGWLDPLGGWVASHTPLAIEGNG